MKGVEFGLVVTIYASRASKTGGPKSIPANTTAKTTAANEKQMMKASGDDKKRSKRTALGLWLSCVLGFLTLGLGATNAAANTDGLLTPAPKHFIAPGRIFAVQTPPNWVVRTGSQPDEIQFVPGVAGEPLLIVRKFQVPMGAHPRQLALNALEQRLRKLPGFKLVQRKDVAIGGGRGVTVTATYHHQGNIQYPRVLEEVFLVHGDQAFILHFECFAPSVGYYADALGMFYASFIPSPGGGASVFDTFDQGNGAQFPAVDEVPF